MEKEAELRERIATIEQDCKSIHRRLDNLEQLTASVHTIATEIKAMRENMNDITQRVDEIERKPTKRYETVVTALITAVIGAVIGYFLKR